MKTIYLTREIIISCCIPHCISTLKANNSKQDIYIIRVDYEKPQERKWNNFSLPQNERWRHLFRVNLLWIAHEEMVTNKETTNCLFESIDYFVKPG